MRTHTHTRTSARTHAHTLSFSTIAQLRNTDGGDGVMCVRTHTRNQRNGFVVSFFARQTNICTAPRWSISQLKIGGSIWLFCLIFVCWSDLLLTLTIKLDNFFLFFLFSISFYSLLFSPSSLYGYARRTCAFVHFFTRYFLFCVSACVSFQ